jgi:hypothetical protein
LRVPPKGLLEEIQQKLFDLQMSLDGREEFAEYPLVHELNQEIADALEDWTKSRLDVELPAQDIQSFTRALADLHQTLSGAERVSIKIGPRSMIMEVEGCMGGKNCKAMLNREPLGCLNDMIIAAILERVMETPIRAEIGKSGGACVLRLTPAWLVDLLSDIDTLGAEGLVVICKDRILFSHLPTEKAIKALSESLLIHEERNAGGKSMEVSSMTHLDTRIMLLTHGSIFVSVCLRPNANEDAIADCISRAIQKSLA